MWREDSLVYTVCACANSGEIPPAPVTIPYTIMHQLDNELFMQVGIMASPSVTFDKAVSYAPWRLFCPYLRLGPAYGTAVKDQCRFAVWHYIIIRRGCGCRCGLGAKKSFFFLRERVDPRLHTYLADDEVRETVLVVDRYVRGRAGRSLFTPAGPN